jgi:hypothetical protein
MKFMSPIRSQSGHSFQEKGESIICEAITPSFGREQIVLLEVGANILPNVSLWTIRGIHGPLAADILLRYKENGISWLY